MEVTTEQFWNKMCSTRFIRTGLHTGRIGEEMIFCGNPPETVPGFLEAKIDQIADALALEPEPKVWPWMRWIARLRTKRLLARM